MSLDRSHEVTALLVAIRDGNEQALNQLVALVDGELQQVAARYMSRERFGHTLQPRDLVQEALVRLLSQDVFRSAQNRRHFFAASSRAMRQVLVDHARRVKSGKRQGDRRRVPFDEALDHFEKQNLDVIALHDALDHLATLNPRQSQIIELRYFGGFSVAEVAELLGVSVSLVEKESSAAMAALLGGLIEED